MEIKHFLSSWTNITTGVPQGSILGPLLFNIYINDIFYFVDSDIANYADDNTHYAIENKGDTLIQILEKNTLHLKGWFHDNYLKINADKCKFLITIHCDGISLNVDNEVITACKSAKMLGIAIDNTLNFNEHISNARKSV